MYLFIFYFLFSLIYFYIYTTIFFIILILYTITQSYMSLFLSISLIKPYLFITFLLPFYSLFQGLISYIILIVPSHFSLFFPSITFYLLLYPTVIQLYQTLRAVLVFFLISTIFILYSLDIVV